MNPRCHVAPLSEAIGAEIRGVDVSQPIDDTTFARIRAAWLEHLVLLLRKQRLDDAALVRFTSRFGELEEAPLFQGRRFVDAHPEVMIVSNVVVDGHELGSLGNSEAFWHSDLNFVEQPPDASCLYALEVPPSGGDTGFANMYRAFETLPGDLAAAIAGRQILHDARFNSAGYLREVRVPDTLHPIVRTHPETGRKALYLGRRANARVDGLPADRSDALLDRLWEHATSPACTWHHRWQAGDLLIWDNRCTLHRRDAFDATQRRILHRTQTRGTRPA
ncbi:MAG TPA: TauD/TfdA family dioxygenase [Casimicrobiaceae bacterium]|nr:TauD/TfdA family dioxygenase [Casimicrobiaceae bacterium]